MGIAAVCPQPGTSRRHRAHPVYPYLLRHRAITTPNDVWAMDITYIPMAHGFVYLAAVMDRASRRVLSWRISVTRDSAFCIAAVDAAIAPYGCPTIVNTDQGVQPRFNWSSQQRLYVWNVGTDPAPRPVFASRGSCEAWC